MSWTLGRPMGIPIRLHASAAILLGFLVLSYSRGNQGLAPGLVLGAVVLVSILVHEFGHAIVARRMGLGPVAIVLHGFGGLTSFGKRPTHGQGILVGLAGPIAGIALGLLALAVSSAPMELGRGILGHALRWTIFVNLFWSAFNLLPMYPLDGGQVLWHAMALRSASDVARRRVRVISLSVAAVVGILALLQGQLFLVLICIFIAQQNRA